MHCAIYPDTKLIRNAKKPMSRTPRNHDWSHTTENATHSPTVEMDGMTQHQGLQARTLEHQVDAVAVGGELQSQFGLSVRWANKKASC